jgi:cytochrome c peroxidase
MRSLVLGSVLLGVAAAAGCDLGTLPGSAPSSEATDLGMFAAQALDDPRDEARAALERDARRREERFLDAANPGHLRAASRPEQEEIEGGAFSSDELYAIGAQLFHRDFTPADGLGGADAPYPRRFQVGFRGGPEAQSCSTCHWRGGIAGGGDAADNAYLQGDGQTQSSGLERNAPSLAGAGWVELAARELSADLAGQRVSLEARARDTGAPARAPLVSRGVSFGALTALPDGTLDTREVEGVSADLVVRPFGRKGTFASLRDVIEDELATHHGMQSTQLVASAADLPARMGPNGGDDPDGDGVTDEISEGEVTVLTLFAAMQGVPIVEQSAIQLAPVTLWATGREAFDTIGCASCHTPSITVRSSRFVLPSRTGGVDVVLDLLDSGASPRLTRSAGTGELVAPLLSDLKRHDMGDGLADSRDDRGVSKRVFVTPPLWGLARSRPYLHDGRAPTLHDAVMAHAGEAQAARDAYEALGEPGQAAIRVFLISQTRAPRYVAH